METARWTESDQSLSFQNRFGLFKIQFNFKKLLGQIVFEITLQIFQFFNRFFLNDFVVSNDVSIPQVMYAVSEIPSVVIY